MGHTCPQSAEGFFESGRTAGITFERDGSAVSYIKDGLRDGAADGPLLPAKGSADPAEQINFAGIKFDGNTKTVWFQQTGFDLWDDGDDLSEIVLYIGEERYEISNRRNVWTGYRQANPLGPISKVAFSGTGSPPGSGETSVWYAYRYRGLPCNFRKTVVPFDDSI